MPDEKKNYRNLSTYAIVMLLAVVILILIAAMADDREEQFENQINEKEETNMSIQNEIVHLKDENYLLKKENEQLEDIMQKEDKKLTFYTVMTEAWTLFYEEKKEEAAAKIGELNPELLEEEQRAQYDALHSLLEQQTPAATKAPTAKPA